jgi:phosphohistidine phosphatase SixA
LQKLTFFIFVLIALTSCNETQKNVAAVDTNEVTTTYYLIRHAEKDRSDPTNKNPELTQKGVERAVNWSRYFENKKIDQVFSTEYSRTMQTAAYTASQKKVQIETYDPSDLYNEDFKTLTRGHNVLIVGHSDTTPKFVNAIIGENKYSDIPDDENGLLFMVTLSGDATNVQLFTVD